MVSIPVVPRNNQPIMTIVNSPGVQPVFIHRSVLSEIYHRREQTLKAGLQKYQGSSRSQLYPKLLS